MRILIALMLIGAAARAEVDAKIVRTWKAKCASCHGADGKADTETGKKAKIPDFSKADWQKAKTDAQIKSAIEDGSKREGAEMEPYKDKLNAAQIDALVKYIRTFK
ncbi:MAG: c-type cytochrome [Myxococcales bacterium]